MEGIRTLHSKKWFFIKQNLSGVKKIIFCYLNEAEISIPSFYSTHTSYHSRSIGFQQYLFSFYL